MIVPVHMSKWHLLIGTVAFMVLSTGASAQQEFGRLNGAVVDEQGGVIVGAEVTITTADGTERTEITDKSGNFDFDRLIRGKVILQVRAPGFSLYENPDVQVSARTSEPLQIILSVEIVKEEVDVAGGGTAISIDPEDSVGAVVLRDRDLDALPEDPEELAAALQALAGPAAGPSGGQISIDGFSGGRMPRLSSIREIRINRNPFSAEFDRPGFGRIEILTKPGSDTFHGEGSLRFNDESLNSRNPYAPNRAPHQARNWDVELSGPIKKNKASFYFEVEKRDADDNAVINAIVLDPALNIVPFSEAVVTPVRRTSVTPRADIQLNDKNTLVFRYDYSTSSRRNRGIGEFSLSSRAYDTTNTDQDWRVTETAIVSPRAVNETRFQYRRGRSRQDGDNTIPTINVSESFVGGGSQVGQSYQNEDRWELHNITTFARGSHALKWGGRLRGIRVSDSSESGFGGSFTFSGIRATLTEPGVSSIEQYRQKLTGNAAPQYNPNQYSIIIGDPLAKVTQIDFGGFVTDDWRVRPHLLLSFGLRYETQSNISSNLNFAPRISFAWAPGGSDGGQSKTVIRGGGGIFYDRFSENFTLQADRFNGRTQEQYIVRLDPNNLDTLAILSQAQFSLDRVTNVPTAEQIRALVPGTNTIRVVDPGLNTPYTMQGVIGIERQLPLNIMVAATYLATRTVHLLRSRNVNAPFGLLLPRPDPSKGNIYQTEASGVLNQHQLIINFRASPTQSVSVFGNYILSRGRSDTDGAGTFPAYNYDLTGEYGRSSLDIRHRFFLGGSVRLPWNMRMNPFITASAGAPFNIVTGIDSNGDLQFTERPAFATELTRPSVIVTDFGAFDISPIPGQAIIPRNYGTGPTFVRVNLSVSKTIGFGGGGKNATEAAQANPDRGPRGGIDAPPPFGGRGRGGMRGGGRGPGFGGGGGSEKPYNLTFSVRVQNLFNRNNPGQPIGNLSSPIFGQSNSSSGSFGFFGGGGGGSSASAGNRRIDLGVRFEF